MRAFRVETANQPAILTDIAVPEPGPRQVRVDIRACGLNFADLLMQKGTYQDTPQAPFTLGMEVAGVINAVGTEVEGLRVGDRVAVFCGQGGLAEQGVFDAARAVPIPDAMPFEHAASFPVTYGTSHMALDHRARMQPGETLLVTGAAGGVGLTAVEIGKLMGATVIAHARGADKLEVARAAGADHLIDDSEDLRARVLELGGADVVYDAVGGAAFKAAFRACRPEARLLPIGFASGEVPQIPANILLVKNLDVIGLNWGAYVRRKPEPLGKSLARILAWAVEGKLRPHVDEILPLESAQEAVERIRARRVKGKLIIDPRLSGAG